MLMIKFKASDMAPCLLALNYSPRLDHDIFFSQIELQITRAGLKPTM